MSLPRTPIAVAAAATALALVSGLGAAVASVVPSDQRLAARAQIRLADLPAGWRTTKAPSSGATSTCLRPAKGTTGTSKRAFAKGSLALAAGLVGVFRSPAQARTAYAAATSDKQWDCFVAGLSGGGATDVRQRRFQLQRIGAPALGREVAASYEQNGMRVTAVLHLDVARKGRAVVVLYHGGAIGPALTLREESTVVRRMVSRLP